jgi:hypothetical protein
MSDWYIVFQSHPDNKNVFPCPRPDGAADHQYPFIRNPPVQPGDTVQAPPAGTPVAGLPLTAGRQLPTSLPRRNNLALLKQQLSDALRESVSGPSILLPSRQTLGMTEQELIEALGGRIGFPGGKAFGHSVLRHPAALRKHLAGHYATGVHRSRPLTKKA